jgi:hypothetical protein
MPRLLVVDDGAKPPVVTDALEDWIRESADERDRQARVATLRRRAGQITVPVFDGMCRLGFGGAWAPLSPIEYRLAFELVQRFCRIVSNGELTARFSFSTERTPGPPDPPAPAPRTHRLGDPDHP